MDGTFEGEPAFLTREVLAEKRRDMGPYVFACQMLQNPMADTAMGFREDWLRHWEAGKLDNLNLYIVVDPAGEKKKGSDYTVMWVVGLGPDGIYYVADGIRDRLNLTQKAAVLMRLHRQYSPLAVGYEKYGMQADIEHIKYVQNQENYHFEIVELGGNVPKNDRIRGLIPLFEQRRVYLPGALPFVDAEGKARNLTREFVQEEYTKFPVAGHDDMLDCLARIIDRDLGAVFPTRCDPAEMYGHKPPLAQTEWSPW
jgi:phage terminase large subunit-like protein